MQGFHHDALPVPTPELWSGSHSLGTGVTWHPDQLRFLDALKTILGVLQQASVSLDECMVISGGAVMLHELRLKGSGSRVPTDIDIVVLETGSRLPLEQVADFAKPVLPSVEVHRRPRVHHG